ncbi:MAG: class I SAM-dependent methyltransferase [bacterium]
MNADIQAVQSRFDRVAAGWDSNPARVALVKGIVEAIRQAIPLNPNMVALDFGAGTGLLTLGLLPYVARITAVDASSEMLKVLAEKLSALEIGSVTPWHGDIVREPLPEAGYDLVVSSMVLHHIADVPQVFKSLRRCLRPAGWIALADLDSEDGSFHPDPTGVFHQGFDRQQIANWLEVAGFQDVSLRDAYRMVRPQPEGGTREYPVFLARGRVG